MVNSAMLSPDTTQRRAFEVWLDGDRAVFRDLAAALWEIRDYHNGPHPADIPTNLRRSLRSTSDVDAVARMLLDHDVDLEGRVRSYALADCRAVARAFIPATPTAGGPGCFTFLDVPDWGTDAATIEREFTARRPLPFAPTELRQPVRSRTAVSLGFRTASPHDRIVIFSDALGQRWWVQDIAYNTSRNHRGKRRGVPFGDTRASAREFRPMGRVDQVRFCDLESARDRAIGEDLFARQLGAARVRSGPPADFGQG